MSKGDLRLHFTLGFFTHKELIKVLAFNCLCNSRVAIKNENKGVLQFSAKTTDWQSFPQKKAGDFQPLVVFVFLRVSVSPFFHHSQIFLDTF
jgi:hypothetical protein